MGPSCVELFVDLVFKILFYFIMKRNTLQHSRNPYFNIELRAKEKDLWYIYVSNRGQMIVHAQGSEFILHEIATSCFVKVLEDTKFQSHLKSIIFVETVEQDKQRSFELKRHNDGNNQAFFDIEEKLSEYFSYQKKYQTLRLEVTIPQKDVEILKNSVITELIKLDKREHNIKLVFHSSGNIFWSNKVEVSRTIGNCKLVGQVIGNIINNSQNTSFRDKCLSLLRIDDPSQAGKAVTSEIMSLVCKEHKAKRGCQSNDEVEMKRLRQE